ncbi:MAG: T9SS type A sorting domain-containing protein [Flavobacteriales bacterium]
MAAALMLAPSADAQVNYTFNFDANSTGWTGNFSRFTGATACGGAGGAMRRNVFSTTVGNLVSPTTGTAIGGEITITYDYKIAVWSANTVAAGTPFGSFTVQYGSTASGPWTDIATVTDEAQTGSCIGKSHTFTPPPGAVFIRWTTAWTGGDNYWNFDNIVLTEAPPPTCSGVPNAGSVPSSITLCSGNTTTITATGLTAELNISYQWEESLDGVGGWFDVVDGSGANTASYTTAAITTTRYYRIRTDCSTGPDSNNSNVATVNADPGSVNEDFSSGNTTSNCWSHSGSGTAANLAYNSLSAFGVGTGSLKFNFYAASAIGSTLIYSSPEISPVLGPGMQLEFDVAGASYDGGEVDTVKVEVSTNGGLDWTIVATLTNEVGDVANTGGVTTSNFAPSAGQWNSLAYPLPLGTSNVRFYGISDWGNTIQIDNIAVTMAPLCSAPTATTSLVPDCGAGTYTVEVTVTGTGDGATVDLVSDVLGLEYAAVDGTNMGGNPYVMGPYTMDSPAALTMEHESDGACDVALGTFNYLSADCPTIVNCGSTTNDTYCYVDNDLQDWSYSASAAFPLVLNFNAGYIENCCDRLRIYDGTDNSGTLLFDSYDTGFIGNDLTGVSATAASGNIFMDFDSDSSVDCADDSNGPWDWDVDCLTCSPPNVASVTVVPACPGGFGVDVQIDDFGSGSSATINYSVNSIAQTPIVVGTTGTTNLTGFSSGDDVDIVVAHESDPTCDVTFNNNTYTCPPANDDCGGAIALTVNPDFACGTVTSGTNVASTASVQPDDVDGTPNTDVWYSFEATGPSHRISLINIVAQGGAFNTTDMGIGVYEGLPSACDPGGMLLIGTSDPETYNVTGLTANTTYYVRVYGWSSSLTYQNFDICVGTPPPPPANDLCANAIAVSCNSVTNATTVNATTTGAPATTCGGYSMNTAGGIWYTLPGFDGTMTIDLSGSSFDTRLAVYTGTCGSLTCVDGDDDDGAGSTSLVTFAGSSSETYYVYVTGYSTNTGSVVMSITCGDTNPACTENGLNLEFQTDGNPGEVTWEILNSGNLVVLSGANPVPADNIGTQALCLPDGCYRLRVLDSGGDGMTTGGYELRTSSGDRIIDNTNNFSTGSVSAISGNQTFCLPLGTVSPIWSSCDKLDWVNNKFIVCHADAAVSAQFGVSNATSGYEFWFYDPNGSFSYRRFRSHATSDGYGSGATRACHFKVNGWFASMANPHLPANVLLNVRVRGRVAGVNQNFGPACQFKLDPALAACPRVKLQDDPANTSDYSCGVSRNFGGPSSPANRIYANPPQPIPVVASSSVRYQFRFRITGENVCIVRPPQTSARMVLNWTTGTPLECSKTYEVDVRVSLDGGATWCFGPAGSSEAAACADTEDWGKVCLVTINPCALPNGGGNSLAVQGDGEFTMYPNPNRGDQLFLNLSKVQEGVNTVNVDIYDLTGKRVAARTIAVQDGFVKTNLDLNGDLSGGMYMVNITAAGTAGVKTYTERLVIQP